MSLIELKDIHKSFYGVEVLHGVNFVLQSGSVHALMGENGAGKSTLMKVIAGVHTADSGKVFLDNKEIEISSPAKARELGIAMIHQELSSELEMSVAENIYLGREPGRFGMVDYRQLYHQTDELLKNLGGNRNAAHVSGINTKRIICSVYILTGVLSALAGVIMTARVTSGVTSTGDGYETDAIAAVVIGGTSLAGGKGRLWGTIVGILIMQFLSTGLDMLGVNAYYQMLVKGFVVIGAVMLDGLSSD